MADLGPISINRFIGSVGRFGTQRSDRYRFVFVNIPANLQAACTAAGWSVRDFVEEFDNRIQSINTPSQTVATNAIKVSGIDYEHPYQMNYEGDLTVNLLLDRESLLRKTMTNWLNGIYPTRTGLYTYRTDYVCDAFLDILNDRGEVEGQNSFFIREIFPKSVGSFNLEAANPPSLIQLPVTFSFKEFFLR